MRYIALCEVDQRQNFILRSDKLREILGGSGLIADTIEMAEKSLQVGDGVELIWPVSGVLWLASPELPPLAAALGQIRGELQRKGLSATFAVRSYSRETFTSDLQQLQHRIKRLKNSKSGEDGAPRSPLFAQCGIQGRLPANHWRPKEQQSRRRLLSEDSDVRLKRADGYQNMIRQRYDSQRRYTKEFEELNDLVYSSSDSYTALCKADCDGMGRLLQKIVWEPFAEKLECTPEAAATAIAQALKRALEAAVDKAISQVIDNLNEEAQENRCFPILPLVMAGDDLWILARRDLVFALAAHISREFSTAVAQENAISIAVEMFQPGKPLTLSFGVLFAKKSFPFDSQIEMAEELEQSAKSYRRTLQDPAGCIDFHWLESSGQETVRQTRESGYRYQDGLKKFSLITRPWTLQEFESVLKAARKIQALPRRKRHQLDTILRYGDELSDLAFTRWHRSLLREQQNVLKEVLQALPERLQFKAETAWFYDAENSVYKSILPELAELAEMLNPQHLELSA